MEFWFALANVYRVLLATFEHPLPLSRTPQDGVWFLRTWWQVSFIFTLQLFQAKDKHPMWLRGCSIYKKFCAKDWQSYGFLV
jgi:hypothetical protein